VCENVVVMLGLSQFSAASPPRTGLTRVAREYFVETNRTIGWLVNSR